MPSEKAEGTVKENLTVGGIEMTDCIGDASCPCQDIRALARHRAMTEAASIVVDMGLAATSRIAKQAFSDAVNAILKARGALGAETR